jgi:hypothetical protein
VKNKYLLKFLFNFNKYLKKLVYFFSVVVVVVVKVSEREKLGFNLISAALNVIEVVVDPGGGCGVLGFGRNQISTFFLTFDFSLITRGEQKLIYLSD